MSGIDVPAPSEPSSGLSDESVMLTNPMFSLEDRLEMAAGAIKFRNRVIANLRARSSVPAPSEREAFEAWYQAPATQRDIDAVFEAIDRGESDIKANAWIAWRAALSVPCSPLPEQSSGSSDHDAPATSSSGSSNTTDA